MSSAKEVVCAQCGDFLGKETGWIDGIGRVCGDCLCAFMLEAQRETENTALRAQLEQAQAEAGAYREALDSIAMVGVLVENKPYGKITSTPSLESVKRYAFEVLNTLSAGTEYADRMRRLEKALELACVSIATDDECPATYYIDPFPFEECTTTCKGNIEQVQTCWQRLFIQKAGEPDGQILK